MSLMLRALELVFAADKRRALLRLRVDAAMRRVQQVAADAENARLDLEDYEREVKAVHEVGRDVL